MEEEGLPLSHDGHTQETACLNCGTPLAGTHCHACGQHAHVHRSLAAVGHDLAHGAFHFEGAFWRTLPLLALKPGELTRRYIRGERKRFVSPTALFLFALFLMFAVFSFTGSPFTDVFENDGGGAGGGFSVNVTAQSAELEETIRSKTRALEANNLSKDDRAKLRGQIEEAKRGRNVLAAMLNEDSPFPEAGTGDGAAVSGQIESGWHWFDETAAKGLKKARSSPDLLLYKMTSNGYKFAWLLIPLSLPFLWLVTLGKRGTRFYDHAVFATYSIGFMSLLLVALTLLEVIGVPGWITVWAIVLVPPVHLYKQLRHAYGFSRLGTLFRLALLLLSILIVVVLFTLILVALGVLG